MSGLYYSCSVAQSGVSIRIRDSKPWPEGQEKVLSTLGGQDNLRLMLGAYAFHSDQFDAGSETIPIHVNRIQFTYRDNKGRRRRFRIMESSMETLTPGFIHMVTVDTKPAAFTLDWLLWITRRDGDTDPDKHRNWYHVGDLDGAQHLLKSAVEDVTGMVLDFV